MSALDLSPLAALMLGWFAAEGMLRAMGDRPGPRGVAMLSTVLAHAILAWLALWLTRGYRGQSPILKGGFRGICLFGI